MLFPGFSQKHLHAERPTGHEGEGMDRTFPLLDDALVVRCCALNPKTIVCVTAGGGAQMDWADKAAAIVHCLYGGQTGAAALMEILIGKVNPSGKLPFTIERRLDDSPGFDVTMPKPNTTRSYPSADLPDWVKGDFFTNDDKTQFYTYDVTYHEGVFVGHRWYESKSIPVRFPFGHGLSYTTFAYEGLQLEVIDKQTVKLRFTLKNTGARAGAEVAQVYVSPRQSSVPRPPQELKGFQKVALQPGSSRCVEITLGTEAFRYCHPHTKRWTVEPNEYEVRIGASSAEIRLRQAIRLPAP
jgi:beta-glucosidase